LIDKKLLGILTVALIAVIGGSAAYSMTWTSARVSMMARTSSVVSIGLFQDCACNIPFMSHDWGGVVQNQTYEVTCYVRNTGSQAVYLTFTTSGGEGGGSILAVMPNGENEGELRAFPPPPRQESIWFDGGQTRFSVNVNVIEGPATPCQLFPCELVYLPSKDPMICESGFLLHPGKVVKIDIELLVYSVVAGGNWHWNFYIEGCAP